MSQITIDHVADYFICAVDRESGDEITPLKLQKMVYYAQAWHLALYGEPLFDAQFQAWPHGPANYELFKRFEDYKYNPIPAEAANNSLGAIPAEKAEFLDEIWDVFGKYTAKALENMTHVETPWIEARGALPPELASQTVISEETMRDYYRSKMDAKT